MKRVIGIIVALAVFVSVSHRNVASSPSPVTSFTNSLAQEDGWTALKTDGGILFIWNRPGLGFTISIKGTEIRSLDAGNNIFFMVDGLVLQIQSLPISDFAPDAKNRKLNDEAILIAHRDWEANFLENELLKKKISVQSSTLKLASGTQVLVWHYDLPEGFSNADAKKQVYVSVVARDYVILLNGVVNSTASDATVREFLLENMAGLKISSERIDVKKMQEKIRKGEP